MTKNPLVSVLMTAYNREKYITEAIESVIASTYQNWELIIVDDCSIDKTVEIAKSYEVKDNRIKVYINENNLGDYPNRNKAASYANGKYLKYVDADDLIYPYGLEQLIFYMEQFTDAGYGLCSLEQDIDKKFPFILNPEQAYLRHYIKKIPLFHKAPLSSIIKKDAFDNVGGFSGKRMVGDFEMWNILSRKFNVVLMPHGIVWYREHYEQEMQFAKNNALQMFQYLLIEKEVLFNENNPLSIENKAIASKFVEKRIARYTLRHIKTHGYNIGNKLRKQSGLSWFKVITKAFIKI